MGLGRWVEKGGQCGDSGDIEDVSGNVSSPKGGGGAGKLLLRRLCVCVLLWKSGVY